MKLSKSSSNKDSCEDDNKDDYEFTKQISSLLSVLETPYDRIVCHIQDSEILQIFKELTFYSFRI